MKYHKQLSLLILLVISCAIFIIGNQFTNASTNNISEKLAGYILLQTELNGEAWYVYPQNQNRYYLGRPADAFEIMKKLSIGITNADLEKIPIGVISYDSLDSDQDGLCDNLEIALGTNINNPDSDGDGINDLEEIKNNYNPLGDKYNIDNEFINKNLGKIFLQVESKGEAWYVNPVDKKRYYLNRPSEAFSIMRELSLGITNTDLSKITINQLSSSVYIPDQIESSDKIVFEAAAKAIMNDNLEEAKKYFVNSYQSSLEYAMNFLDDEGLFDLGNLMLGAKKISSSENKITYQNSVFFYNDLIPFNFILEKQTDDSWLLTNL